MKIGIRAHDVFPKPNPTIEEIAADIKNSGFTCTQLALSKAITTFNTSRTAMTPGLAMYLRDLFAANGIDIAVLGCYYNLANPNKQELVETLRTYQDHIRFASILGSGVVGTETGAVNEQYKYEPANHSGEALATFINGLQPVVAWAEKLGVIFAIEPVWNHIVCNVERTKIVLDTIKSPNLQIIFDPVNLLNADNHENNNAYIQLAFDLFGEKIAVIHLKDYIIENGTLKSVPCGMGMMDYKPLMKLLKDNKPYIHALLEDTTQDNAKEARAFVERAYAEA